MGSKKTILLGLTVILLALGLPISAAHARSAPGLYVLENPENYDAATTRLVERYFADVQAILPASMKSRLGALGHAQVRVVFDSLDGSAVIPVPSCKVEPTASQARPVVLGRTNASSLVITLNAGWVDVLRRGKSRAETFACGHHDLYTFALAVLAHETSHVYDFSHYRAPFEQAQYEQCAKLTAGSTKPGIANPSLPAACRTILRRVRTVSDDPDFLALQDWKAGLFRLHQKNVMFSRVSDAYAMTNPKEDFAVNFEFFLVDPEFSCRMPALFDYYRNHFGWAPPANCRVNTQVPLSVTDQTLADLNPDRIYAVHYLFAGKDSDLMSRWGHAMVRLVVCAPEHKDKFTGAVIPATPYGPECLRDIDYHVVGSYRANVEDLVINSWSGIVGKYPSQLFLLPMSSVIDEYTRGELRELTSYPMKLSDSEKRVFVYRMLEQYWSFQGRYRFIGENCANEAGDLIASVDDQFSSQNLITPLGLRHRLQVTGLIDDSLLADLTQATAQGYYFPPASQALEPALAILQPGPASGEFKARYQAYMGQHNADERAAATQARIAASLPVDPAGRLKAEFAAQTYAAAALLIESQIDRSLQDELMASAMKVMDEQGSGQGEFADRLRELSKLESQEQPSAEAVVGYGIPLSQDFQGSEANATLGQKIQSMIQALQPMILDRVGPLKHESEQTVQNINAFRTAFLGLNQAIAADEGTWLQANLPRILGGKDGYAAQAAALESFLAHTAAAPGGIAAYRALATAQINAKAGSSDHISDRKIAQMLLKAVSP